MGAPAPVFGEASDSITVLEVASGVGDFAVTPTAGSREASPYSSGLLVLAGMDAASRCVPRIFSSNGASERLPVSNAGPETVDCALVSEASAPGAPRDLRDLPLPPEPFLPGGAMCLPL
jgi:hypothetical protein